MSTGGRCTPRNSVQSWQLDTMRRLVAAMSWRKRWGGREGGEGVKGKEGEWRGGELR